MRYQTPKLEGYQAIGAIRDINGNAKSADLVEPPPHQSFRTDAAYQADE